MTNILYAVAHCKTGEVVSEWFKDEAAATARRDSLGNFTHYIMDTESLEEQRNTSAPARAILETLESEIAILEALETDIKAETTKALCADMWLAGHKLDAANMYVESHFTGMDTAKPVILANGITPADGYGSYDAVDVTFRFENETRPNLFTVWVEDVGNGPFLYGEW